jgi:hypothetical protein
MSKCNTCKKEFNKDLIPKWIKNKNICEACFKLKKSQQDKKYRDKNIEKLREKKKQYYLLGGKKKVCPVCKIEHNKATTRFCSNKCYFKYEKVSRVGKKNPAWKNAKHPQTYNKLYFDYMYNTKGLLPDEIGCEICKITNGTIFDRHHIIFKSEKYNHKELNNPLNIIQVCRSCHLKLHSKNIKRKIYIEERGLEKLFGCKLN